METHASTAPSRIVIEGPAQAVAVATEMTTDGRRSALGPLLKAIYPRVGSERMMSRLRRLCLTLEGGPGLSLTIREILSEHYRVRVGLHTPTPCVVPPKVYHSGTSFGRYTHVADTLRTFTRNHPFETKSTHGLFYNAALGRVNLPPLPAIQLRIGNGVWIDHNTIILPPTEVIGEGAIITAGSVVYTNVPPYAIVGGFPARTIGYRFPKPRIEELLAARWWEFPPEKVAEFERNADLAAAAIPIARKSTAA
ncbi:MAG: CatB-related O-acetyltransferase [Limisphaerales bacterium]